MKEPINPKVVMTAILCLTAIEIIALLKGLNGTMLLLVFTLIGALAGWVIPFPLDKK